MRIKFLKAIAERNSGYFEPGQIIEMPDEAAKVYLGKRYDDGSRLAIEVSERTCPHCGGRLEGEQQGPPGAPEAALEAATMNHAPRRRG